jgi:hypothetical protein
MSIWQIVVLLITLGFQLYKVIPKKAMPKKPSANESKNEEGFFNNFEEREGFFNIARYPWVFWCITYLKLTHPGFLNEKLEGVTMNWILKTLLFVCTIQGYPVPSVLLYFKYEEPVHSMFEIQLDKGISVFASEHYKDIRPIQQYLAELRLRQKSISD